MDIKREKRKKRKEREEVHTKRPSSVITVIISIHFLEHPIHQEIILLPSKENKLFAVSMRCVL